MAARRIEYGEGDVVLPELPPIPPQSHSGFRLWSRRRLGARTLSLTVPGNRYKTIVNMVSVVEPAGRYRGLSGRSRFP